MTNSVWNDEFCIHNEIAKAALADAEATAATRAEAEALELRAFATAAPAVRGVADARIVVESESGAASGDAASDSEEDDQTAAAPTDAEGSFGITVDGRAFRVRRSETILQSKRWNLR